MRLPSLAGRAIRRAAGNSLKLQGVYKSSLGCASHQLLVCVSKSVYVQGRAFGRDRPRLGLAATAPFPVRLELGSLPWPTVPGFSASCSSPGRIPTLVKLLPFTALPALTEPPSGSGSWGERGTGTGRWQVASPPGEKCRGPIVLSFSSLSRIIIYQVLRASD